MYTFLAHYGHASHVEAVIMQIWPVPQAMAYARCYNAWVHSSVCTRLYMCSSGPRGLHARLPDSLM